jgi:hypothetical protein
LEAIVETVLENERKGSFERVFPNGDSQTYLNIQKRSMNFSY